MRILFVAHRIPYPPNKGDKIRSYHELAYLAGRHEVHLACLADQAEDLAYVETLAGMCARVACERLTGGRARVVKAILTGRPLSVGYFRNRRLAQTVHKWLAEDAFDAILAFSSTTAQYVWPGVVKGTSARAARVMDLVDVDSEKFRAYARRRRGRPAGWVYAAEGRRLARYEAAIARTFDRVVLVSEAERRVFEMVTGGQTGRRPAAVVPNGVDTAYFAPGDEKPWPNTIVFAGAMDYAPNVDATVWFATEILPRVRRAVGGARLRIVGARPSRAVHRLAALEGVEVAASVPDIRPYVRTASVSVAPMRIARGIQNKILEAMAMGVPVVTTPAGLEGLACRPGEDVLVADGTDGIAQAVCRVLADRDLGRSLSRGGRAYVEAHHRWERSMADLEACLAEAAAAAVERRKESGR